MSPSCLFEQRHCVRATESPKVLCPGPSYELQSSTECGANHCEKIFVRMHPFVLLKARLDNAATSPSSPPCHLISQWIAGLDRRL